jgi:hypothetical protein
MVNAGAPCHKSAQYPRGQGFWQIDLHDGDTGPTIAHHWFEPGPRPGVTTTEGAAGTGSAPGWQVQLFQ